MVPNELLNRMLDFAESVTDQLQKAKLINGAYNTWYLNTFKQNPYFYDELKKHYHTNFILNRGIIVLGYYACIVMYRVMPPPPPTPPPPPPLNKSSHPS